MADCDVTEISKFLPDGHGAIMTNGKSVDFDIVVKCTGFHLNQEVVNITGHKQMFQQGYLDVNLFYTAEVLLDASQFVSPYGSSYVGMMMTNVKTFAKFFKHEEWAEHIFSRMRKETPCDE